ncbi:30S ribosomal protein S10, mitochondrial [Fusarium austroafricanum]|uniref:Small ribosomal subunit protein uS10m n=1 Tax=Fusarium austroafricanum TaxID=2364996 RepID=A0A8H4KJY4_9HYPO|nr:30S ribosomal protein S10, mitochondrial [Fusarium austroafricanum]
MTDISDDQVDELLRKAEQRLKDDSASAITSTTPSTTAVVPVVTGDAATTTDVKQQKSIDSSSKKDGLTVRAPPQPQSGLKVKEKTSLLDQIANKFAKSTAGPNWFDLPKTNMTPEFKREWQVLRMRGILDPKHQKKALRASAPEYSQVGEIIAGPTEFYSARLTRKERKGTLLEEVTRDLDSHKFTDKYAGIQKQKSSGKKAFYKNVSEVSWIARRTQASLAKPGDLVPNKVEVKSEDAPEQRLPRAIQALHLKPLKREAEHGIPSCDLQLRSYSVQPLEFFSDFALRAAYYLGLPAYGPVPLPRITERWTVPRDNFIFKKSQENFERKTLRRLIQIRDGNPETVQLWLAYLRKHQFYGVGMKANMWEFSELGVGKKMDALPEAEKGEIDAKWSHLGQTKTIGTVEKVEELLNQRRFREAAGLKVPPTTST